MTTKDVAMKDVKSNDKDANAKDAKAPVEPPKPPTPEEIHSLLLADLKKNATLLEKTVQTKETRLTSRVLRSLGSLRRRVTSQALNDLVTSLLPADHPSRTSLLKHLAKVPADQKAEAMDTSSETASTTASSEKKPKNVLPEVEIYLHLLVTLFLLDKKLYAEACESSTEMVNRVQEYNRRTLNPLSAKAYFYYSLAYEKTNRLQDIRGNLLAYHRTASLRHNEEGAVTLLILLLRNYLEYNLYDQADKLVSKTTFDEEAATSNQHARYLYYLGKIKSVQLEYTNAYTFLLGAIRKAPQDSAFGFRRAVYKLTTIVQLLMGEIPERSIFRQQGLKKSLQPYLEITQAVRIGDLNAFREVVKKYEDGFKTDKTYTLIQRLRHNVIKTGLRKINTSYSRISFADISAKLCLESTEDVEFIVAKAIRDGVISATIDHGEQTLKSRETYDVYSTQEPQSAFHRRIQFCLNTHNDAVKAMRYPPNANKLSLESDKERREREQEIANTLADDEEDF
eukprot:TRINITY_DN1346_c0_g1_i2.p1 TRINITY_DN1346_c0_g1~~TRINITY_DN1346_c0_g1_i2.p1  ORF type:complete len:510 (-),score=159.97 TRINITY_DN1346_c0_g1_i2:55-1584(-)